MPGRPSNTLRSLVPLTIVNVLSLALGLITAIYALLYNADLTNGVNLTIVEPTTISVSENTTTSSEDPQKPCHHCEDYRVLLVTAVIISIAQALCSFISLFWPVARKKTNLWCAIHSLVFVGFAPILVFTAVYNAQDQGLNAILSSDKRTWFSVLLGVDMTFSLAGVIFVALFYGMEVRSSYTLLEP